MKVLVTGCAGFIGQAVTKRILQEGHSVVGLDSINSYYDPELKHTRLRDLGLQLKGSTQSSTHVHAGRTGLRFYHLDITDKQALHDVVTREECDHVVHLAAQAGVRYSLEQPQSYIDANLTGSLNLFEAYRHSTSLAHLVYASSSSVYGRNASVPFRESDMTDHPSSLYAASKKSTELMAETYAHLFGIPMTGLRFFTVYGPYGRPDMAPMLFANALRQDTAIKIFNHGQMARDFTFIDDIVEGIWRLLHKPPQKKPENQSIATAPHRVFNIGRGSPVALEDFIHHMEQAFQKTFKRQLCEMQPGDVVRTWADCSAIQKLTGWQPQTNLEDGIKRFADWFQSSYA